MDFFFSFLEGEQLREAIFVILANTVQLKDVEWKNKWQNVLECLINTSI